MPRSKRLLFALFLVGAFVLRVANNTYLLPPVTAYPNEEGKRDCVLELAGDRFDHGCSMPSFLLNSMFVLYYPVRWVHQAGQHLLPGYKPFAWDINVFYLWFGRIYMALFGTATVAAVFALGRRLRSEAAGWAASACLALAPIAVLGSRHLKEDIPLGLFATLAIIFRLDVMQRGRRRDSVRAGLLAGVCFSTKWMGILMLVPLLAAHWIRRKSGEGIPSPGRASQIRWALLFFFVGFCVFSPDFLLRPDRVKDGLERGVEKSYSEHSDGMRVEPMKEGLTDYFRTGLWPGLTPPLLVLALIGWSGLLKRAPREAWFVGVWVVVWYLLLETATARPYPHYQRYLQTFIPALTAFAGCGIVMAAEALHRIPAVSRRMTVVAAVYTVAFVALLWPAYASVRYLYYIPRSTIYECAEYLNANVPEGALIVHDKFGPRSEKHQIMHYRDKERLRVREFPQGRSYALITNYGLGRFLEHPDANPEMTRFVHYVQGVGQLEKEWRPHVPSFYCESPRIRLYRFDGTETLFHASEEEDEDGEDKD